MKLLAAFFGLYAFLPVAATALPPSPPTTLVIIGCRVDDLTGQPGRHPVWMAARNWKDLEWHLDRGLELECKREVVPLVDPVAENYSRKPSGFYPPDPFRAPVTGSLEANVLTPDFSNWGQCAARAMEFSPKWADTNKGWWPMAVGCPTPITLGKGGPVVDYKLPECPNYFPGTNRPMKCKFDESLI